MESNFQTRNNEGSISCVVRSHDPHVTVMWLSLQEANGWCEEGVYDQLRKMLGEMVRRTAERGQFHLCCCVYIAAALCTIPVCIKRLHSFTTYVTCMIRIYVYVLSRTPFETLMFCVEPAVEEERRLALADNTSPS